MSYEFYADQELPAIPVNWADEARDPVAFATGWTATVKVATADDPTTVLATKTTGITLADTYPNVTIGFTSSEFDTIRAAAPGVSKFVAHLYVRRNSDSKDRAFNPPRGIPFTVHAAPA